MKKEEHMTTAELFDKNVKEAVRTAERFIATVKHREEQRAKPAFHREHSGEGRHNGAILRASLDLSASLATIRRRRT